MWVRCVCLECGVCEELHADSTHNSLQFFGVQIQSGKRLNKSEYFAGGYSWNSSEYKMVDMKVSCEYL